MPFHGVRDRKAKLQEVAVLQSLRHSSKVVQLIDSWEYNGHLYIQTEFCSEGSLDAFLKTVGQTGRLDDFRIWKILLEATQVSCAAQSSSRHVHHADRKVGTVSHSRGWFHPPRHQACQHLYYF